MKTILIATRNPGKFRELAEALSDLPFRFVSLQDEAIEGDVEETGETYEANAILKAEFFGRQSGLATLADDSGIHVEALKEELGVKTRRWGAGSKASDEQWLAYFLERMRGEENRRAEFVSVVALFRPGQQTLTFRGECKGRILEAPQVTLEPGVPLSSVFLADGQSKVFSALSKEEKNAISHRGRALRQCQEWLLQGL